VQRRPLFAINSATAAPQDLFEDLASDEDEESPEQLSRRPPSKAASAALPSITPTQFSLDIDDEFSAEAFESPSKRQRTAQSPGSSALPFSQSSLPSVHTTPSIRRIGDIPQRYYDMEDDDSDFFEATEESIFEVDAQIQAERTVDPSKMAANRKAIIHNHGGEGGRRRRWHGRRSSCRRSWGDGGSSRDLLLLLLGGLWEDNGAGDEGRPQRPVGRVVVGWAERRLD
jgi:hypothetical protein